MAKTNVTASVTVDGLTYTATIDRQSRSARPTVIECSDGRRWTGEWDSEFALVGLDDGQPELADDVRTELNATLDAAVTLALRGR